MHEKLFAPLGMVDTGFWIPPEKRSRMATGIATAPASNCLEQLARFLQNSATTV
jgi:CubicO group peptidase (beta-lactamase class C family)